VKTTTKTKQKSQKKKAKNKYHRVPRYGRFIAKIW